MNARDIKEETAKIQICIEKMISAGVSEKYLSGFCMVTIQRAGAR